MFQAKLLFLKNTQNETFLQTYKKQIFDFSTCIRYLHKVIHDCPLFSLQQLQQMFIKWKVRRPMMTRHAKSQCDDVWSHFMNYSGRMLRKDENRPMLMGCMSLWERFVIKMLFSLILKLNALDLYGYQVPLSSSLFIFLLCRRSLRELIVLSSCLSPMASRLK